MQKFSDVILDKNGKAIQGAIVTVTTYPDGQPATIYAADGGSPVASVKSDQNGRFSFYAPNGLYSISVAGSGIKPVTYNDYTIFDPTDLTGPAPIATYEQNEYAGNRAAMPVIPNRQQLMPQVWKTPVHINLFHAQDPQLPAVGPIFKLGNTGLTSGAFWSQDSYIVRNGTFVGGPPETISFEPWTGTTAVVENNRILNSGAPDKWHVNFKQQNWWPIIRGNTFGDYTDKKGNFCKAIDDGGDPALRYSANSRVIFNENRCKWLGAQIGGIGFYGSAVANKMRDNAFEGSGIGVVLGAPSTFSSIDGLYNEMPFSGAVTVMLGDKDVAPNNTISFAQARDVFSNVHGFTANRVFSVWNSQVVVDDLTIDRVFATGLPSNPPPLVQLNDLAGQKIRAGVIYAEDAPLIPLLTNHVAVIDMYRAAVPTLNGDIVFADQNSTALTANTSTAVARNWFAKSSAAGTFARSSNNSSSRRGLRQSRYIGVFGFGAGATSTIAFQLPRANQYEGEMLTVQWLLNSTQTLNHTATVKVYNPDGSRTTLRSKTVTSNTSWNECTMSVYVSPVANSDDSLIVLELTHTAAAAGTVYMTGVRFNRGSFGLSGRSDAYSYPETVAKMADFSWLAP